MDSLSTNDSLERELDRVDVLKHGLRNSFAIDFRNATHPVACEEGTVRSERFHFLSEIEALLEPRVRALSRRQRRAYDSVYQDAVDAFWRLYADFQPMVQSVAQAGGIEVDELEPVLGRAILLFERSRGTKFVTYLEKTLRESVKNIRGKLLADELQIPLSAGRLVPQLIWQLDQAAMQLSRTLSAEESDSIVVAFLREHSCRFSEDTMRRIAEAIRDRRGRVSLNSRETWWEPSAAAESGAGNDGFLEHHEECEHQLRVIDEAMDRAGFDPDEVTLTLARMDLPHDERRHDRIASQVTTATLRKRKTRLLVRLMAARFSQQAPRFGSFLRAEPLACRQRLQAALESLARARNAKRESVVDELLNWMSLSDSVYRTSIVDRGRLRDYLCGTNAVDLKSPLFAKLKAALIEQDRLDFPCLSHL